MAGFATPTTLPEAGSLEAPLTEAHPVESQTLSALIEKLEWIRWSEDIVAILRRYQLDSSNDHGNIIPQMEEIFGEIHAIENSNFHSENARIWAYITRLEELYSDYIDSREEIREEAREASWVILSNEFLDDSDLVFTTSIADRLEASQDMTLDELIDAAQSIELSGTVNGREAWDSFFEDLEDDVAPEDLAEFRRQVAEFRSEYEALYTLDLDTSSLWTSLDAQLADIESGRLDAQFESDEGVPINIDVQSLIGSIGEGMGASDMLSSLGISWENLMSAGPFHSKEEAVRTIYKLKLVFNELEKNSRSWLASYYLGIAEATWSLWWTSLRLIAPLDGYGTNLWPGDAIVWILLWTLTMVCATAAAVLPFWVPLYFAAAPLESGWRRIQDRLSVWLWDKWWSRPLTSTSRVIRRGTNIVWNQAVAWLRWMWSGGLFNRFWNLIRFWVWGSIWAATKPFDLTIWWLGSLLSVAETRHLDASNMLTDRVVLIDGLTTWSVGDSGLDNATSNEAIEIRSRVKIITLLRRVFEYEWNATAIAEIDRIANGVLFSNSESFYIDVHRVRNGELGDSSSAARRTRFWIGVRNIMTIPNRKEAITSLYRDTIRDINGAMDIIYRGVQFDSTESRVTIPENPKYTTFIENIMSHIDLSLITDAEEIRRQNLLVEYIEEIQRGRTWTITPEIVRREMQKIAEWYEPTFRIIREIVRRRNGITNENTLRNLEDFRRLVLEGWWEWTTTDLENVLNRIDTTPATRNTITLHDSSDFQSEWERLRGLQLRWSANFDTITNISHYSSELRTVELLIETWEIRGANITNIRRELQNLFSTARDASRNIDFTIPEFNHAVYQILLGRPFSDMWDGRFWDTSLDIDSLEHRFGNFNTQVTDVIQQRLLTSIDSLPTYEEKATFIERIHNDTDLVDLRRTPEYQQIVRDIQPDILRELTSIGDTITSLRDERSRLFWSVTMDQNDGLSNNIAELNTRISNEISTFEGSYSNAIRRRANIGEQINFINSSNDQINAIRARLSQLTTSIEEYNARSRVIPPVEAGETPRDTPVMDPAEPIRSAPIEWRDILNQRIEDLIYRVLIHDTIERGENSIMADGDLALELERSIREFLTSHDHINESNFEGVVLENLRNYLSMRTMSGHAWAIPLEINWLRSMDELESIIQSRIDSNMELRWLLQWMERTPRGIFDGIFNSRNRGRIIRFLT